MDEAKEFLAEVIKKLAVNAAQAIYEKAKNYLVDRELKDQVDIGSAYERYLEKTYDTYSKSKTILYDDKPEKISSFYIPADLLEWTSWKTGKKRKTTVDRGKSKISTKNIEDLFEFTNKVIITGIGGMGKTMLMKHFCFSGIEKGFCIPVFISLRRFNNVSLEDMPLEKLIFDQLKIFGFELDYKYFEYSLEGSRYMFLFDGYDELNEAKRATLSYELSDFAKRYSENVIVISSRKIDDIYSLEDFTIYSLCPMTREQTTQLIWKLDFDYESKKRFINELNDTLYDKYMSFVSVPLLLSILFLTYVTHTKLPETLNEFYEKAFETLLFKHDRLKMGFDRVFKTKLSYEMFRKVFLYFCFFTYFKEMYSFTYRLLADILSNVAQTLNMELDIDAYINDLVDISCMLILDGQEYVFLHRSFQEYFAAVFVSKKNDEKQSSLCSAFINKGEKQRFLTHRLDKIVYQHYLSEHVNSTYQGPNERYIDFLNMLNSVEPERFESIVLIPIARKIYKVYQDKNENLLLTAKEFFNIISDKASITIEKNINVDIARPVSFNELTVIFFFYNPKNELMMKNIMRDQSISRQAQAPITIETIADFLGIKPDPSKIYGSLASSVNLMLRSIAIAIVRFKDINKQNRHGKDLDEALYKFIEV